MKKRLPKRTIAEVKKEIANLINAYESNYFRKLDKKHRLLIPRLYSDNELEKLFQIWWLKGYLQGLKDERGLK